MTQVVEQERKDEIRQRLETGAFSYDRDFIRTQASSQQSFYNDYERRWGTKSQGFLVEPPYQPEPAEMEIQERKLTYKEKKRRKKEVKANYTIWKDRIRQAGYFEDPIQQKDMEEYDATVVETSDTIYGLGLNREADQTPETFDVMNRTLKLGEINKRRVSIYNEATKGNDNPILTKYANEIISLGPPLIPDNTEEMSAKVTITKKSEDAFKAYVQRIVADPVNTIREAISDTLFSFGDISEKMLDKECIAQRFDQVKLLRDKLKAVTDLLELEGKTGVAGMTNALKKDKESCPPDNVLFAKALYSRIDADMRACLTRSGMTFKDDGQLVDREDISNASIKRDGKQSAALLRAVKKKVKADRHLDVERHWDKIASEMLLADKKKEEPPVVEPPKQEEDKKEEKKEEKKEDKKEEKREFKDTYNIAGAVSDIAARNKKFITAEGDKKLFSRLFEVGNQIAMAVSDIDRELEGSEDYIARNKEALNARPGMETMLRRYIAKRKQQQLDLIDRAKGVINAMKYLARLDDLNANGSQVLRQQRYALQQEEEEKKKKTRKKAAEKEEQALLEQEGEAEIFSGHTEDARRMARLPLSSKEIRKRLFAKFKNEKSFADFKELFDSVKDTEVIHMLTLSGKDIFALSYSELFNALIEEQNSDVCAEKLQQAVTEADQTIDFLYEFVVNKAGTALGNAQQKSVLVDQYCRLREKIYAINKLKAMKPLGLSKTYDALLKEGKTPEELTRIRKNELVSKMQFKIISDIMEAYRCSCVRKSIEDGVNDPEVFSEDERKQVEKLTAGAKMQPDGTYKLGESPLERITEYYNRKQDGLLSLLARHTSEINEMRDKDEVFREILSARLEERVVPEAYEKAGRGEEELNTDALQDLFGEMQQREAELVEKQRKEKEKDKPEPEEEEKKQEEEEEEEEEEDKKEEKEKIVRTQKKDLDMKKVLEAVEKDHAGTGEAVSQEYETVPKIDVKAGVMGAVKGRMARYIRCKDLATFKKSLSATRKALAPGQDPKEDEALLSKVMIKTMELLAGEIIKDKVVQENANRVKKGLFDSLNEEQKGTYDLSVNEADPDYIWFMNQLDKAKNLDDLMKLRNLWGARKIYSEQVFEQAIDENVFSKIDGILYAIGRAIDAIQKEQEMDSVRGAIVQFKRDEELKLHYDLKTDDFSGRYRFDQPQQGTNACWTASHTYVVNTYMTAHGIEGQPFTQATLKNPENFVPHEKAKTYIEDKSDQNAHSMSFNQEADNIRGFLTQDKVGNPYTMADSVITRIPRTAEHHLVFNTFNLKKNGKIEPEVMSHLTEYLMDKVEKELMRTRTPISVLRGGHYLSIVGVDRAAGMFLTMNSNNPADKIDEEYDLSVNELLSQDVFEMVFPEYLDEQNLGYLQKKFGLKEDLYDQEGRLQEDEKIREKKQKAMEEPQNMLHVHGYEFDLDDGQYDYAFESAFLNEQIYMPSHLDLPAQLEKQPHKEGEK